MFKYEKNKIDKEPITIRIKAAENTIRLFISFVSLSVCALTVIAVTGGCKLAGTEKHKVYAASENESSSLYSEDVDYDLPSGIAGVVSGVNATPAAGSTVNRIGISCDDVIVGQRVRKVTSSAVEMNVSESMATTVDTFDAKVVSCIRLPQN